MRVTLHSGSLSAEEEQRRKEAKAAAEEKRRLARGKQRQAAVLFVRKKEKPAVEEADLLFQVQTEKGGWGSFWGGAFHPGAWDTAEPTAQASYTLQEVNVLERLELNAWHEPLSWNWWLRAVREAARAESTIHAPAFVGPSRRVRVARGGVPPAPAIIPTASRPASLQQQPQPQLEPAQLLVELATLLDTAAHPNLLRWHLLPPGHSSAGASEGGRAAVVISDTVEFKRHALYAL